MKESEFETSEVRTGYIAQSTACDLSPLPRDSETVIHGNLSATVPAVPSTPKSSVDDASSTAEDLLASPFGIRTDGYLLPSEVARLVLGYLQVCGAKNAHRAFLSESKDLEEYRRVFAEADCFDDNLGKLKVNSSFRRAL